MSRGKMKKKKVKSLETKKIKIYKEIIYKIQQDLCVYRLWIEEKYWELILQRNLGYMIENFREECLEDNANKLISIQGINAVEITFTNNGSGLVWYKNWP